MHVNESKSMMETLDTPLPIFKTYIGNLLYSTPDLTDELKASTPVILGQTDIQDIYFRDFGEISSNHIQHHHNTANTSAATNNTEADSIGRRINILSTRQKGQLGSNPLGLSVDTPGGRKVITVSDYSKIITGII